MPQPNILLDAMLAHADPAQVAGLSRFFKTGPGQYGEGDKFLGIKVPVTRAVVRECWRSTSFADLEECIRSEYHELRLAALLALVEIFRHPKRSLDFARDDNNLLCHFDQSGRSLDFARDDKVCHSGQQVCHSERPEGVEESLRQQCVAFYLAHTAFINNWDLVDLSCHPLLGEWLLDKDRSLLYELARSGRTLWEQRIGIVSTMTFIRHGQLEDTFAIADILLHHPHDLIHKAVGWLLREAGKRDKSALEAYLSSRAQSRDLPRYQVMPRTTLRYAIERFPEPERQAYLTGRA